MKVKSAVVKVRLFRDDDEVDELEETLPVKKKGQSFFRPKRGQLFFKPKEPLVFRMRPRGGQQFFRRIRKRPDHEKQGWFKHKFRHNRLTTIEELHDGETYCFFEMTPTHGSKLRVVPGYRLKRGWKSYKKAFSKPLSPRFRKKLYKGTPDSNWIDIILPNGMTLSAQPRSATPSYYNGDEKLNKWLFEKYGAY